MTQLTLVEPGGGDHHWLLGVLATIKAGNEHTDGSMTIAEFEAPPGWAVPPHRHHEEDELYYVLDGEVKFWCEGEETTFSRGGMAWLPRQRAHAFVVSDAGPARLFNIHTGPQFERLVHALGEPAPEVRIPDPPAGEPDLEMLAQAFANFGIELVDARVWK
jgi:quercetin dioxygenase-like cupin family protein